MQTTTQSQLLDIHLKDIVITSNYRHHKDTTDDAEFLDSVFKHGVLQAIMVRPKGKKYELVCGDRRVTAGRLVQKKYPERNTIPAMVRTLSDEEVFEIQIIENLQRKDVHPMDEAMAYKAMADKDWSIETIAAKIDKSTKYVANRLKLIDLIPELQEMFFADKLSLGHCLELCKVSAQAQKDFMEDEVYDGEYDHNVQQIKIDLSYKWQDLDNADFDITNKDLIFGIPACTDCPKNTACQQLLFPDEGARCTDKACFKRKSEAKFNMAIEMAKQDVGVVFIEAGNEKDGIGKQLKNDGYAVFNTNNVRFIDKPEEPVRKDYDDNNDTPAEDDEEFNQDMVQFKADLAEYEEEIKTANKALVVSGYRKGKEVYYHKILDKSAGSTASENPDLDNTKALILNLESRLNSNASSDDRNIHDNIYDALLDCDLKQPQNSNSTEWTLLRFMMLSELDDDNRDKFFETINKVDAFEIHDALFLFLMELSNSHFQVLMRLWLIQCLEHTYAGTESAYMMRKLAEELGVDIHKIVMDQQAEATTRDAKLKKQITDLKAKLKQQETAPDANTLAPNAKKVAKKGK